MDKFDLAHAVAHKLSNKLRSTYAHAHLHTCTHVHAHLHTHAHTPTHTHSGIGEGTSGTSMEVPAVGTPKLSGHQ